MEKKLKESLKTQTESHVVEERQDASDIHERQQLDKVQGLSYFLGKVLGLPINLNKKELGYPVVEKHRQKGKEDTKRSNVREPNRDKEDPDDVLIIVGAGYLVALPKSLDIGLRVRVRVGVHLPHPEPPQHLEPHGRVEHFEERFREGIGQHKGVDVDQQQLVLIVDAVPVDQVDRKAGVDDED